MRLGRSSKFVVHIIVSLSVLSGIAVIIINSCGAVRGSGFRRIARRELLRFHSVLRIGSELVRVHSGRLSGNSLRSYSVIHRGSVRVDAGRQIWKQDEFGVPVARIS